jgi:hypothetical protein
LKDVETQHLVVALREVANAGKHRKEHERYRAEHAV